MALKDSRLKELCGVLDDLPLSLWGFADIAGLHPLADEFPWALSMALSYTPAFEAYDEQRYHVLLHDKRDELNSILDTISTFLRQARIHHYVSPDAGQDNTTLMNRFPHKLAATRAGLGWIGKNCLLVTRESGPRVRLGAILLDADVPVNEAVTESECGECRLCVEACPYECLHDVNWRPGMERAELFDAFLCHNRRNDFIRSIGRKHECGLCLLACPIGKA